MSASRIDSTGVGGALRLSPPPFEFSSFGLHNSSGRTERKGLVLAGPSGSFLTRLRRRLPGAFRFAPLHPMPWYVRTYSTRAWFMWILRSTSGLLHALSQHLVLLFRVDQMPRWDREKLTLCGPLFVVCTFSQGGIVRLGFGEVVVSSSTDMVGKDEIDGNADRARVHNAKGGKTHVAYQDMVVDLAEGYSSRVDVSC
jgi:hypothetical protein